MKSAENEKSQRLPLSLKPLLWGLKWDDLKIDEDIQDIVTGVINEGTMDQWKWLVETYGKEKIRQVLQERLATEFHPESRHLAQLLFSIPSFRHERRLSH
jgi:hypothetical protein